MTTLCIKRGLDPLSTKRHITDANKKRTLCGLTGLTLLEDEVWAQYARGKRTCKKCKQLHEKATQTRPAIRRCRNRAA